MSTATQFAQEGQAPLQRVPNKVGRPRAFQDEDVYKVMMNVISRVGYSGLTFALIAEQIKCTTSALIRRFGDKRSLIQGFILWLSQQQGTIYDLNGKKIASPIERIRARWLVSSTDTNAVKPELFLAFFVEVRSDPAYRPQLARLSSEFESRLVSDLNDAVTSGDISSNDTTRLAHTLVCAVTGAVSLWMDRQLVPIADELNQTIDSVLEPYVMAHTG